MKYYNVIFSFLFFVFGCQKSEVKIHNFDPFSNFNAGNDSLTLFFDYKDAIDSGFVVPSKNQTEKGKFIVSFDIVNNSGIDQEFYYKLYYQNESYKFPEVNPDKEENALASENFYGSWENTSIAFKKTEVLKSNSQINTVKDEIRIVGNPRNEKRYFGQIDKQINEKDIEETINRIKANTQWYNQIIEKAKNNNISIEKQLRLDAVYVLNQEVSDDSVNQRWKRNPRVGKYSFMLVVIDKETYEKNLIPEYIRDINKENEGRFVNPYYYFLYGNGSKLSGVKIVKSENLILKAKTDFSKGLFIDNKKLVGRNIDKSNYRDNCGDSEYLYKNAQFQQFFHDLRQNDKIKNVPVVEDIFENDFTIDDFNSNKTKYTDDKLVNTNVFLTDCPCKTVKADTGKIVMINPATKEGEWKKESVGVKTRHGFTYGKYRTKVKMTKLLNKSGVWNGITNAIWLIFQNGAWNNRRSCDKIGYIPKDQYGKDGQRFNELDYSEIDFEIVKTSRDWPETSYKKEGNIIPFKKDNKDDVIVACTNWDMACPAPAKFDIGVHSIKYKNSEFLLHRWDHWYKAVTLKTPANENELFGSEFYYFEIDWKPTEIIWRIGPSPDKMRVVGYINDEYTSIPNNQMLMVFTQEFHLGNWWPMTQFNQDYIPFPKSEYIGEIYELEIE